MLLLWYWAKYSLIIYRRNKQVQASGYQESSEKSRGALANPRDLMLSTTSVTYALESEFMEKWSSCVKVPRNSFFFKSDIIEYILGANYCSKNVHL